MDRLSSFASQAKAKAEAGRTQVMAKYESHHNSSSASASSARPSATSPPAHSPVGRARASSALSSPTSSSAGKVFVGIDDEEKEAFYALLDEYFSSRPQYAELFGISPAAPPAPAPRALPPRQTPQAPPAPPTRRGLGTATALYDYPGGEPEDLSLTEGDKIVVLEKVSDDWWKGETGGRTGIFPSSYVSMD